MAKLNITFVNEVGNNLNRYKAIDVNTGDEYLFDLSRNGTITIPGTPLNAEIMNAIVSAINEHFSNLVVEINDTTPSDTKYPSEKAVVDYVGQIANEESVDVSDNVLIKISGVSDNLALPSESQMEVNSIEGNSVVVNQLAKALTSADWSPANGASVSFTDGVATLTPTQQYGRLEQHFNYVANHRMLIMCDIKLSNATDSNEVSVSIYAVDNLVSGSIYCQATTNWQKVIAIVYSNSSSAINRFMVTDSRNSNWGTIQIKNYKGIDLTQWFGSNDNIPQDILNTPSNFFKYYKGSLAYDTGHIENGSGNLVDTNRNIWDEETRKGYYNTYGEFVPDNSYVACLNPIIVNPNETIYWHSGSGSCGRCCWYDKDDNFISSVMDSMLLSAPSNARYLRFDMTSSYGTTYNHDICINVSDTNFNGTYVSHIKNTLNFGNDILRSAGNARDKKIPDGEIERKVGRVDLGTLDWVMDYNSDGHQEFRSYDIQVAYNGNATSKQNLLCTSLDNVPPSDTYRGTGNGISFAVNYVSVGFTNGSYTDATTFKAAMSGVYLNYELATPTIEQGTPYNNHIPVYYGGQEFTTGDVPFVINKNYDISIKDQVITNVRVDKEQSEQIHALENVNREQSNAIDSLNAKVNNLETTQEAHSTSISSLTTKVTDLESYKFDSSKLTIEQNLVNTILKYNNVEINRIENLDVAYLPNIVFDVYQDSQFTAQEKVTITNSTDMDMYVSIKGLKEHNNLFVPFGESITSQLEISDFSGFPDSYIATIEIKIYYNPKTNYNATTGYTVFENVKTINLRATVHPTDR